MALKALLESMEGVDDAVKPLYAERDGKFVLDVEGIDDHPEVASLRNAYSRTKEDREKAKTDAQKLRDRIAELEKSAPDTAATQAKLSQLQEQLEAKDAEVREYATKYMSVTRDQALANALQAAGITDPTFLKASTAMLNGQVKLGDDGTAYVETGMGPKVLTDFVKGWAAGEGKSFVTGAKGGGAKGNDGGTQSATMLRADFDQLPPDRRASFIRDGGKLTE